MATEQTCDCMGRDGCAEYRRHRKYPAHSHAAGTHAGWPGLGNSLLCSWCFEALPYNNARPLHRQTSRSGRKFQIGQGISAPPSGSESDRQARQARKAPCAGQASQARSRSQQRSQDDARTSAMAGNGSHCASLAAVRGVCLASLACSSLVRLDYIEGYLQLVDARLDKFGGGICQKH